MRLPFFGPRKLADADALYAAIVAEARLPHWYRDAGVPDSLDGRFAVLTSLLALADIRLERGSDEALAIGPRLTERFIADMDAQMREAGFGDPGLGKQVRTMVGSLASRVDRWRLAVRKAFLAAFTAGYRAVGFAREDESGSSRRGYYVLQHEG